MCHGAPDVERRGFAQYMSPEPPGLAITLHERDEGRFVSVADGDD